MNPSHQIRRTKSALACAVLSALISTSSWLPATPAVAQSTTPTALFGALSNFDVLNDTGQEAHGFEIELDGLSSQDAVYFYTYNRYGRPTVVPFANGIYVRYMSQWDPTAQQFAPGTPIATNFTPTAGHQCVGVLPSGCEHFGVSTARNPTKTVYRWMIADPQNPGALMAMGTPVAIPAPIWTVVPPAQIGAAPVVIAEIQAPLPPPPQKLYGDAQWVKVYKTELPRAVGLDELMTDDPVVPEDPAQIEVSWDIMQDQVAGLNGNGNRRQKRNQGALGNGSHAVIRRYEFYKFSGAYDPVTHQVICGGDATCSAPLDGELGDYIGAQMAAANVGVPSVTVANIGNGSVSDATGKLKCGNVCFASVPDGALVTLTANPGSNVFTGWSGACNGADISCSLTVHDSLNVTATFKSQFTLSIGRSGSGVITGTPGGNNGTLIDCGKNCSAKFTADSVVTLTATAAAGQHFVNWTGDCSGVAPVCSVTISKDTKAQANFAK